MKKFKIKNGQPYPLGAFSYDGGINFSIVNNSEEECGIILYKKGVEQKQRIPFDNAHKIGNISCLYVEGMSTTEYEYNFYIGDKVFVDPYAKKILGNEKWRGAEFKKPLLRCGFCNDSFDWKNDKPLQIPYHENIIYCLHVRGFTKHRSSGVKHKGTFEGLIEKIPYLKDLGINAVELLPAYEFEEYDWSREEAINPNTIEYQVEHFSENVNETVPKKLNYWGFKEAYYFSPKASYAAGKDACNEFKKMVSEFHKNGIEVIMQFYFPNTVKQGDILEILKFWFLEYHIDGFHVKGDNVPTTLIATEPLFANTKIMCEDFYLNDVYPNAERIMYKNLGYYRDEFMYDIRRFLKSDHDMLKNFQYHMRNNNPKCGVINYLANYYGFTLNDLVSYERKHNELNGEDNRDGTDYNYSWNCGVEGPSRKKNIVQRRKKQMKNALSFLFTAQGTPLLYAGDEFGNSQNGNNNCYCQDNDTGWVDWRGLDKNADIYEFVKEMIKFRKEHGVLHLETALSTFDRYGFGYPDLSYHGEEAWKVQLENYNRHIGIMYCGMDENTNEADHIYIAYNMHWDSHVFALPSVADCKWVPVIDTLENHVAIDSENGSECIEIPERSVVVLVGKKVQKTEKKSKKATKSKASNQKAAKEKTSNIKESAEAVLTEANDKVNEEIVVKENAKNIETVKTDIVADATEPNMTVEKENNIKEG